MPRRILRRFAHGAKPHFGEAILAEILFNFDLMLASPDGRLDGLGKVYAMGKACIKRPSDTGPVEGVASYKRTGLPCCPFPPLPRAY